MGLLCWQVPDSAALIPDASNLIKAVERAVSLQRRAAARPALRVNSGLPREGEAALANGRGPAGAWGLCGPAARRPVAAPRVGVKTLSGAQQPARLESPIPAKRERSPRAERLSCSPAVPASLRRAGWTRRPARAELLLPPPRFPPSAASAGERAAGVGPRHVPDAAHQGGEVELVAGAAGLEGEALQEGGQVEEKLHARQGLAQAQPLPCRAEGGGVRGGC